MGNACCAGQGVDTASSVEVQQKDCLAGGKDFLPDAPDGETKLPSAAAASGSVFYITIDKTPGGRLGVDVDPSDGATLLVEDVTGGVVGDWNRDHPNDKVMKGDRIVEINGAIGDVRALVEECKKNQVMKMGIKRSTLSSAA
mmetsp:Transcript_51160/g.147649  ORF Transcript_51160/g.147649 Transcript_51160/m.147649 type:complete len:142 (-) Transcript_51160:269-694(-)